MNIERLQMNSELARALQVDEKTIKRWQKTKFPEHTNARVNLLKGTHPDWLGFKILNGSIITPAGENILSSELNYLRWMKSTLRTEVLRSKELENKLAKFKSLQVAANNTCNFVALAEKT